MSELAIVIPVRLDSSRLPRKHLEEAAGVPFLEWLCRRQRHALGSINVSATVVIATTDRRHDDPVEDLALTMGVAVYRGESENVPRRLARAAASIGARNLVCVDGDDVACSLAAVRGVATLLTAGFPRVRTGGLPLGMNAHGCRVSLLLERTAALTGRVEVGWTRVIDDVPAHDLSFPGPARPDLRLTLDYVEDAQFFRALIDLCGHDFVAATDEHIVGTVDRHGLSRLNTDLATRYWENYHAELNAEIGPTQCP